MIATFPCVSCAYQGMIINAIHCRTYTSTTKFGALYAWSGNPRSVLRRLKIQTPHDTRRENICDEESVIAWHLDFAGYSRTNVGYEARSIKKANMSPAGIAIIKKEADVHLRSTGPYGVLNRPTRLQNMAKGSTPCRPASLIIRAKYKV